MNIPVDGIIVKCSGVMCSEAAMTGESDEMKKETIEHCLIRMQEKEQEAQFNVNRVKGNHDIPSPVLLSGT
jgi:magnesium-transporting ATPase (P-type)